VPLDIPTDEKSRPQNIERQRCQRYLIRLFLSLSLSLSLYHSIYLYLSHSLLLQTHIRSISFLLCLFQSVFVRTCCCLLCFFRPCLVDRVGIFRITNLKAEQVHGNLILASSVGLSTLSKEFLKIFFKSVKDDDSLWYDPTGSFREDNEHSVIHIMALNAAMLKTSGQRIKRNLSFATKGRKMSLIKLKRFSLYISLYLSLCLPHLSFSFSLLSRFLLASHVTSISDDFKPPEESPKADPPTLTTSTSSSSIPVSPPPTIASPSLSVSFS
jgi:hypothetical protein